MDEVGAQNVTVCKECPAGSYCPQASENPVDCPRGYYCEAGVGDPVPCPIGRYGNATSKNFITY